MAVNVPNPGQYLAQVGTLLTDIRDRMQQVQDQNGYIASMGGAAFLTTAYPEGLGMTTGDAQMMIAVLGNHTALAIQYEGGPVAPQLNYKANGQPLWGGQ
jgi:hypothetical protein